MKLSKFFTTGTRDNGETFTTLTDDRPEWLQDAIREAHVSDLPNDWIYAECSAACDAIDDESLTDEDSIHEYADGRVDIYTKDLARWYADMCLSDTFASAESDAEDIGPSDDMSIDAQLRRLQYFACARIARTMLDAFNASKDEEENGEEEDGEDARS